MFDIMYLFSLIIIHRLRLIEDMGQHLIQKITIIEILIRKITRAKVYSNDFYKISHTSSQNSTQ